MAGVISDYSGMSATTCSGMFILTVPMLFVYQAYGNENMGTNVLLLMLCGLLVNGPYALITTAISAELGTHHSLEGNSRALATVTAIIDGTGSIGEILISVYSELTCNMPSFNSTLKKQNKKQLLIVFSGAAIGPFVAGLVAPYGWNNVFYILMGANIMALLVSFHGLCYVLKYSLNSLFAFLFQFLCRIVVAENQRFLRTRRGTWTA